jgi:hypothetical protein
LPEACSGFFDSRRSALWQQAREAKGPRTRFFEHSRTISAYLVFPFWQNLMNTLISCNATPTLNCCIRDMILGLSLYEE